MAKRFLFLITTLIAFNIQAQEGTASPYSFFGIGSLKFKGTVENRSMGGLSIYTDSIHINLRNPASYAGRNLPSFGDNNRPVKFAVGGSHSAVTFKSTESEDNATSSSFDYIAMSIPMGKFGFGFGLMPYTSVGYKLESYNDSDEITNRYSGSGGLNKAFLTLAYKLTDDLSIGVDANYNFGNIQNSSISFAYSEGILLQYQTIEDNRSDLSGLNYNFGLSYKKAIGSKLELVSGITYSPENKLSSNNQRAFYTLNVLNGVESNRIDDVLSDDDKETELTIPSKLSFGAGLGEPKKWFLGAEYVMEKTSDFKNEFLRSNGTEYEDGSTLSMGGFYIPNYKSLTSYWKRVVYRAGFRVEETGLNLNSESISEFGISFGVGLPVGRRFSNANIGFEIGKRGTTNNNLIQENFVNVFLGLSLNDRWFEKRKYD